MRGVDLDGLDLKTVQLEGAVFDPPDKPPEEKPNVRLLLDEHKRWVETGGATGSRAVLDDRDLSGMDLRGLDLSAASLNRANLARADLGRAQLRLTNLMQANLTDAILTEADLAGAVLVGAIARRVDFSKAKMTPIDLKDASGKSSGRKFPTNLSNAILSHAKFDGADMRGAVLRGADITRATFLDSKVEGIDLAGVKRLS